MNSAEKLGYRTRGNDSRVIESLYDQYAPTLLSLCKRYCGNIADAEDVLHDGFIKIIRKLPSFSYRSKGSFEGWMKKIMVNTALNYIRDHSKERSFLNVDPIQERISQDDEPNEDNLITGLIGKVNQEKVMALICELPPGYRTVFNLYVFESYSHKEIAAVLNCSENTSKSQLSKARALLRKKVLALATDKYEKQREH